MRIRLLPHIDVERVHLIDAVEAVLNSASVVVAFSDP
jgi:hypothetical protein